MSIELTESAANRIRRQLDERGRGVGLRVEVKPTGCSGYGYALDYADSVADDEVAFESRGETIVVPRGQLHLLEGLTVDFRREGLNELFRFDNPNAEALCGCGESFTVEKAGS